jgi:hypothetical protein
MRPEEPAGASERGTGDDFSLFGSEMPYVARRAEVESDKGCEEGKFQGICSGFETTGEAGSGNMALSRISRIEASCDSGIQEPSLTNKGNVEGYDGSVIFANGLMSRAMVAAIETVSNGRGGSPGNSGSSGGSLAAASRN